MPLYTTAANVSSTGYKNLIHNGAMTISQRDPNRALTSGIAMTSASGSVRVIDRWACVGTSGAWSVLQGGATLPPGFGSALQFTCTTAASAPPSASYWILETDIEGYDAYQLAYGSAGNQKTVTLSFWANVTGMGNNVTLGGALRCWYAGAYRSFGFTFTVTTAGTWQRFSVVVPGDSASSMVHDGTGQMSIIFAAGAGSGYIAPTNNSWVTGNYVTGSATNVMTVTGAQMAVTGVQLELGTSATNFEVRSRQVELALCQRYLYIVGNTDASGIAGIPLTGYGIAAATNFGYIGVQYPVQMRTVPTFSYSSLASIFASDRISNFALVSLAFQLNAGTPESSNAIGDLVFGITAFAMTARSPMMLYTATTGISWLQFAAEL